MKINKTRILVFAAMSILIGANLNAGEKDDITIPECKQPPELDGTLNDACWKAASKINNFTIYRRGPIGRKTKDTQVLLTRDNKFLYIGLICHNSNMQHVDQMGMGHDDDANYADDSVEILLGRKNLGHFYSFILTCGNMQGERRIARNAAIGWNTPWASAARRTDRGWTGEAAIPLFITNSRKPGDIKLNFLRNKIEITLDRMKAKQSEKKVMSCWRQATPENGRSCWPPFDPVPVNDTQNIKGEPVFLPRIERVEFKGYEKGAEGKLIQTYNVKLRNYSDCNGTAVLEVAGDKLAKPLLRVKRKISAYSTGKVLMNVPTTANSGKLSVIVYAGKLPFQKFLTQNETSLISDAFAELNYYTNEKTVKIKIKFNLSDNVLKDFELLLTNAQNAVISKASSLKKAMILSAPANKLNSGKNIWTVSMRGKNGKEYEKSNLIIIKLASNPGKEIKIDRFRRIVLVNGKPFFMFGMLYKPWLYGMLETTEPETTFGLYKKTGFNTVINSYRYNSAKGTEWIDRMMKLAQKHNLMVIDRYNSHREALGKSKEYYNKNVKPFFMKTAKIASKYDNLLGYWNLDEPNLGTWRKNLEICEWYYRDMKQFDPYREVFALYARNMPPVPAATKWFDVFGFDVYSHPGWTRFGSDVVNFMAAETLELDAKLKKLHKPIYMMPMPTALDLRRSPLGLTYQEQLAQNYTALIYGAKGLLYFAQLYSWGGETWRAFRRLASDLKALQPALMALPVDYELEYPGKDINPSRKKFPLVHAGLFKYPNGDYVLLAVNSKTCPVNARFSISGLINASRMFETKTQFKLNNGAFSERLEPLAIRAYKLNLKNNAVILKIKVAERKLKASGKTSKSEPVLAALYRVSKRKNLMMNPSFEWQQRLPGVPDYYHPLLASFPEKAGAQNHPFWKLDRENPYHGKYCFMMKRSPKGGKWGTNGLLGRYACEKLPASETTYTLSLYMRGHKNGDTVTVKFVFRSLGKVIVIPRTFNLTTKWNRYSFPVKLKNLGAESSVMPLTHGIIQVIPAEDETIWVDAIQIEKGTKATGFSDN